MSEINLNDNEYIHYTLSECRHNYFSGTGVSFTSLMLSGTLKQSRKLLNDL